MDIAYEKEFNFEDCHKKENDACPTLPGSSEL